MSVRGEFNAVAYRDVLMNMILGLVILMSIAVLLMAAKKAEQAMADMPVGNLRVHIDWPPGNNDVDLWVDGPGQQRPVGYSHKSDRLWNLMRDDIGTGSDASNSNYEDAVTRGVVAGEYTINLFCYGCPTVPQQVYVEVTINTGEPHADSPQKRLFQTTIALTHNHQERTVIRFRLKADGTIVPGSETTVFKSLLEGK